MSEQSLNTDWGTAIEKFGALLNFWGLGNLLNRVGPKNLCEVGAERHTAFIVIKTPLLKTYYKSLRMQIISILVHNWALSSCFKIINLY
jgi:hypothetical protein